MALIPKTAAALALLAMATSSALAAPATIGWENLRPADQHPYAIANPGNVAEPRLAAALQGRAIRLSGYMLPFDREGDMVHAFLLVPWTGACSHTAPPPPNQVIMVYPEKPYRSSGIYEEVIVSGPLTLGSDKAQILILDGVRTVDSGYRIDRADVAPVEGAPSGAAAPAVKSPWKFLKG